MAAGRKCRVERLSGIENERDRRDALDTIIRAFTGPQGIERHMVRALWRKPVFDPQHTRVAVADGRVTAAVVMAPRVIRFGTAAIPAMTLGPVATHDHFRKHGFAAAAMNDASRYMEENGILAAYLQGIPDFYHRFGYYPFMSPSRAHFKRDDAKKEAGRGRLRALTPKDLPAVRRLFEQVTAERICAAARDGKVWDWLWGPGRKTWFFANPKAILDGRRLCGYLTMTPKGDDLNIREIIVKQEESACRAALAAIVREARRREIRNVSLPLPYDDALAVFLRQYVSMEFKMHSSPTGGALLKIVDFAGMMRALQPLLSKRWKEARTSIKAPRFTLRSEIGSVGITVGRGVVDVGKPPGRPHVKVPQRFLSGMLTGYHEVRSIAPRKKAHIPEDLLPALEILFPRAWPFVYQADNY